MERVRRRNWAQRVRDFVLYVVISLVLALGALWFADRHLDISHDQFERWGGLAFNTAVLFGFIVSNHRRFARYLRFWVLIAALFAAHLSIFVLLLFRIIEHWSLFWFVIAWPVEVMAFGAAINAYCSPTPHRGTRRPSR